jgi:hypothetical protein
MPGVGQTLLDMNEIVLQIQHIPFLTSHQNFIFPCPLFQMFPYTSIFPLSLCKIRNEVALLSSKISNISKLEKKAKMANLLC